MPAGGAAEVVCVVAGKRTSDDATDIIGDQQFLRLPAKSVELLRGEHRFMGRDLEDRIAAGINNRTPGA